MKKVYYAIGDIHGMDDMLAKMHDEIIADYKPEDDNIIVHLGDYVDRGKQSAQVIARIRELEQDFKVPGMPCESVSLMGNHEDMMIKAYRRQERDDVELWLMNGGWNTLDSYNPNCKDMSIREVVSEIDIEWLEDLPYFLSDPENKILFVHAGVLPNEFPKIERAVALWTRSYSFFHDHMWKEMNPPNPIKDWLVVHGHTPRGVTGEFSKNRINLDTGACFSDMNRLSCAKIVVDGPQRDVTLIQVHGDLTVNRYPA